MARPRSLREVERETIAISLDYYKGDKVRAAESLGISLKTLYNKLHTYALFHRWAYNPPKSDTQLKDQND